MPNWLQLLLSALTGGLAGACLTLIVNWLKSRRDAKRAKIAQVNVLKEELLYALWLIEYNHGRIRSDDIAHKGLTAINTSNVKRVLFGTAISLALTDKVKQCLRDYLQQVVYHNNLVAEQALLIPYGFGSSDAIHRINSYMAEIKAICTPNNTYRENDPEPSLRTRTKQLLQDLDELKL